MLKGAASPDGSLDPEQLHAALDQAAEGVEISTAADVTTLTHTLRQVHMAYLPTAGNSFQSCEHCCCTACWLRSIHAGRAAACLPQERLPCMRCLACNKADDHCVATGDQAGGRQHRAEGIGAGPRQNRCRHRQGGHHADGVPQPIVPGCMHELQTHTGFWTCSFLADRSFKTSEIACNDVLPQVLAASSYAALLAEAWDVVSDSIRDAEGIEAATLLLRRAQDMCGYETPIGEKPTCSAPCASDHTSVRFSWLTNICISGQLDSQLLWRISFVYGYTRSLASEAACMCCAQEAA